MNIVFKSQILKKSVSNQRFVCIITLWCPNFVTDIKGINYATPINHFYKDNFLEVLASLGPSKSYVTPRGGEGVDDFVTYRYVSLRGREGVFYQIVT